MLKRSVANEKRGEDLLYLDCHLLIIIVADNIYAAYNTSHQEKMLLFLSRNAPLLDALVTDSNGRWITKADADTQALKKSLFLFLIKDHRCQKRQRNPHFLL